MATSIEHYQEAERLIRMSWEDDREPENAAGLVARAQVHATLAFAAVTATRGATTNMGLSVDDGLAWVTAASVEASILPEADDESPHRRRTPQVAAVGTLLESLARPDGGESGD